MTAVVLEASGGERFTVDYSVIKQSQLIKTMLDDLSMGAGDVADDKEAIPLPNVTAGVLTKVIQWLERHKDDPPFPTEQVKEANPSRPNIDVPAWDREFLKVDQPVLFELILAANYLDIKGLLDVSCKTVTGMMVAKTPEEVRELFNITNDFTEEEEALIREQNSWCEK